MKLAYADPPYLGMGARHYGARHPDAARWDELQAHIELLGSLAADYDGWAYSLSSSTLATILPHAPVCRVAAWVKPFAAFKRNVRIAYTWEPVLFVPARDRSADGAPVCRDHLAESITLRRGLTGAKPAAFNRWILDLLGYCDGDDVVDLFPGTGGMALELAQGTLALRAGSAE